MKRLALVLLLCFVATLGACSGSSEGGAPAGGRVVVEDTVSPNGEWAASADDVVYYTVSVSQRSDGTVVVSADSNSGFFESQHYEIAYEGTLSEDDVDISWLTVSGGATPAEDDQIAIAEVRVSADGAVVDERRINFVSRAIEMAFGAMGS